MRNSEWSLVLFTIIVQMAVGCFIMLGIVYHYFFLKSENEITQQFTTKFLMAISALLVLALVFSFMHLGSPKNAIYSLKNVSSSWLSREILFVGIFTVLVGVITFTQYKEIFTLRMHNVLAVTTSVIGLISIFSMSKIYMISTVPAWNDISTPIQFYLTAFILGIVSFVVGLFLISGQMKINIYEILQLEKVLKVLLIVTIILIVAQLVVWLLHIASLSGGGLAGKMSYSLVIQKYAFLFYSKIFLTLAAISLLTYLLFTFDKHFSDPKLLFSSFLLALISELLGRYLFYSMFARVGV